MELNFSYLSKVEDCDALLQSAQDDKFVLNYKLVTLEFRKTRTASTSSQIESELNEVNAELPDAIAKYENLPDGPEKTDALITMRQLEVRQLILQRSLASKGDVLIGVRDLDLRIAELSLEEIDKAIALIETRKAELLAA